jgi:hypothetical protein
MPEEKGVYIVGSTPHVDEFLRVPGARVTVDNTESSCKIEEALAVLGRIAATQPGVKVRYWISIE